MTIQQPESLDFAEWLQPTAVPEILGPKSLAFGRAL
jgi:hypothetical protein